jgi:hypothetical protein
VNNDNNDNNDNHDNDNDDWKGSNKDKAQQQHPKSQDDTFRKNELSKLKNYSPGEETIRNDYLVEYIVSGVWNASWIKGVGKEDEECRESV